ncbi:hypothetical protein HanXRQr2_Chr08g0361461 [Helianthus annuus]|uniref:Uncharacterized protein n=1 Tax=Helianthus annuus TaxID=4232 RepID=A0A9K3NEI8_HELAN|nr:hypothetical protein HanXRQr2_Chr08g0361461 [Helianthus annuus]KAJ0903415.1 hypothetical protein HanPSC8_Chr08g0348771 [Helianthus annuus]
MPRSFGCNYVGQRYGCCGWKLVPCPLVLLGKFKFTAERGRKRIVIETTSLLTCYLRTTHSIRLQRSSKAVSSNLQSMQ